MTEQTITTAACPDWCESRTDPDHAGWDQPQDGGARTMRTHSVDLHWVSINQDEVLEDGQAVLQPARVDVWIENQHLDERAAADLMIELAEAHRQLISINRDQRPVRQVSESPARPTEEDRRAALRVLSAAPSDDRYELIAWLQNELRPVPDVDL
jgi:hypothetical protein